MRDKGFQVEESIDGAGNGFAALGDEQQVDAALLSGPPIFEPFYFFVRKRSNLTRQESFGRE